MLSNQLTNDLQPLCFEHHTGMGLVHGDSGNGANPVQEPKYACLEPDCLVRYTITEGYFFAPLKTGQTEQAIPHVCCSRDGALMYLAEVRPEERSFRLWRCPLCKATSTSGRILVGSTVGTLGLVRTKVPGPLLH